jgi:hypothetical protein
VFPAGLLGFPVSPLHLPFKGLFGSLFLSTGKTHASACQSERIAAAECAEMAQIAAFSLFLGAKQGKAAETGSQMTPSTARC